MPRHRFVFNKKKIFFSSRILKDLASVATNRGLVRAFFYSKKSAPSPGNIIGLGWGRQELLFIFPEEAPEKHFVLLISLLPINRLRWIDKPLVASKL